ncbi:DUF2079 domain-containing protein [Paraliomyxa miuraensis]|uniref:DUF2079 domain-containing protein n=1 Tax=Paraliomyxa miuraensis TaxID=376150 RepID=UPI0022571A3D|nr:DUF2079 domain-containing protein [Paraliomyxa miuraensis]MCX4239314.1 DUF2079 domain-containing protein [Paraliomyxa miuraensis]
MAVSDDDPTRQREQPASRLVSLAVRLTGAVTGWGLWLVVIGLAPGLTLWAWLAMGPDAVLANALSGEDRVAALAWGAVSLVVVVVLHGLGYVRAVRRDQATASSEAVPRRFADYVREVHRLTWVSVLLPLTLIIGSGSEVERHPWLVCCSILTVGVSAGVVAHRLLARPAVARRVAALAELRAARRLCGTAALVCAGIAGLKWIEVGLWRHHAMLTNTYDLGIFSNLVWNSSQGDLLACSFLDSGTHTSEHFDPIMVLLAPLAWIPAPLAETLIVFQAVWLCAGAWPLYKIAVRALGHPAHGLWMVVVYVLYPPVQANALWDFHSLSLATPLVLWLAHALDDERGPALGARLLVPLVLLLLVREELALVAALYGVVALRGGVGMRAEEPSAAVRRLGERRGLVILTISVGYFLLVLLLLAPGAGLGAHSGRYASLLAGAGDDADVGLASLLAAVLANPAYVLSFALSSDKVIYAVALGLPLLMLPLAASRWILPVGLGVAFTALATSDPVFDPFFHYTTLLFPVLMAAMPLGVLALTRPGSVAMALGLEPGRVRAALCLGSLVASLAFATSYSVYSPVGGFRAGFKPIPERIGIVVEDRRAWVLEVLALLPTNASLAVSGYIGPLAAERPRVYHYPREHHAQEPTGDVDYLLVWTGELREADRKRFTILEASEGYERIASRRGVVLLRRTDRDIAPLLGPLPARPGA